LIAEDWADNVAQNIEQFFRHHQTEKKDGLVRPNLEVQELEQKMARTWVFFPYPHSNFSKSCLCFYCSKFSLLYCLGNCWCLNSLLYY